MFKQFFLTLATMALLLAGLGAGTGYAYPNGIIWYTDGYGCQGPLFDGHYVELADRVSSGWHHNLWACASDVLDADFDNLAFDHFPASCFSGPYNEQIFFETLEDTYFPVNERVRLDYVCARQIQGPPYPSVCFYYYTWSSPCSSPGKREGEPLPAEPTTWGQIKNAYKD